MIDEHRADTIVKILETAQANNGVTFTKLLEESDLSEHPDILKIYLSILANNGFMAYDIADGVYRTTHKGMKFSRSFSHTLNLLSNLENE